MSPRNRNLLRLALLVVGVLAVVGIGVAAVPLVKDWSITDWWKGTRYGEPSSPGANALSVKLVANKPDTIELTADVVKKLGVQVAEVKKATQTRPLQLSGSLNFDFNNLAQVRARFPGEIVEIGTVAEGPGNSSAPVTTSRPVRPGDRVVKGQLLAVVWNADLGGKKAELADALSALKLDQKNLEAQKDAYERGAIPPATVRLAERAVEMDLIRVNAAERTLRTWRVPEEEIAAVKEEATRIAERQGKRDKDKEMNWARVELRAPFDGTVVQKDVAIHNFVDTSTDLFRIAKLDQLTVYANAYEEDLPALDTLPAEQRRWQIRLQNEPHAKPMPGMIERITLAIDPTQHTAMVVGDVENRDGHLRAGQYITAIIELPPPGEQVVIPTAALVEDGKESIVFVQTDPNELQYAQRSVAVARREMDRVYVRLKLTGAEEQKGLKSLQPGERVVTGAAIILKAALEDLLTASKK